MDKRKDRKSDRVRETEKRRVFEVTHTKPPFHLPSKLLSHEASLAFTGSLSPGRTAGSRGYTTFVVRAGAICVSV